MAVMYKATRTFGGIIRMRKGDVREIKDEEIAKDLLNAGYVIELADESKPKTSSKKSTKKKDGESNG